VTPDYNEADTCRIYVTPRLRDAGWELHPASMTEQRTFTDGRILVTSGEIARIFGGADQLRAAVERLQSLLYAA
jgi:type I site-specific restriction endonuclease